MIELEIPGLDGALELRDALEDLGGQAEQTGELLREAFDIGSLVSLERKVTTLRAAFTRLKNAILGAFEPILNVLAPILSSALNAVTGFVNTLGQVFAGLFGGVVKTTKQTVKTAGGSLKRFLADFDEIQRLGSSSGGGSTVTTVEDILPGELPDHIKRIVDEILRYLKPLQEIDFTAAKEAFNGLVEAVRPIGRTLFAGLEWVWFNILVPLGQWGTEQALPAFLELLTEGFRTFDELIQAARPALQWLWEEFLEPIANWTGEAILEALGWLTEKFQELGQWIRDNEEDIQTFIRNVGEIAIKLGAVKLAVELLEAITGGDFGGLGTLAVGIISITTLFDRLETAIQDSKQKFDDFLYNLNPVVKRALNGISSLVNGIIGALEGGINAAIRGINSLHIDIPGWIPVYGGQSWSPGIPAVNLPRIPALANGAVLPANRPFLAVVGDQTHGTNVEAPLSVIEEAVASVMASSLEGQDRTVELLSQILAAVSGITVGDEVIGRAARRYEQKMARMGGF